jgi:hypothetical protein
MAGKQTILVFYEYFLPGYKAGGPVQSLANLIMLLKKKYAVYVITTRYDLHAEIPYTAAIPNTWNEVMFNSGFMQVWYAKDPVSLRMHDIKKIVEEIKPDFIYLNGIYTFSFVFKPLLFSFFNQQKYNYQLVVCPRGMLQQGALAVKSAKKKIYFSVMKFVLRKLRINWHATTVDEEKDIRSFIGNNEKIITAENIPKKPLESIPFIEKKKNELKLVFLSLITEKKNLYFLIQLIQSLSIPVELHIIGPVKDEAYWKRCKDAIGNNKNIKYCGDVVAEEVQETFSGYHGLILPTKGENFGHAIYESLSTGRPVITSCFTPWNNLEKDNAGWNIEIDNFAAGSIILQQLYKMEQGEYDKMCEAAFTKANVYYKQINLKNYYTLFSQ